VPLAGFLTLGILKQALSILDVLRSGVLALAKLIFGLFETD
jgi:hypothetical protein